VIHHRLGEWRLGRVERVCVFTAEGPQAQAWSGEMEVKLLTPSCHLPPCPRPDWGLAAAPLPSPGQPLTLQAPQPDLRL